MAIEGHRAAFTLNTIAKKQPTPVVEGIPVEILAPEQLKPEPIGGIVTGVLTFVLFDGGNHLPS